MKFILFIILALSIESLAKLKTGVLTFSEWKNSKISQTSIRIEDIKNIIQYRQNRIVNSGDELITMTPWVNPYRISFGRLNEYLVQEEISNEVARQFTIKDYLNLYILNQQDHKKSIEEVSTKMPKQEVMQLLQAYTKAVENKRLSEIKQPTAMWPPGP